MLHVTVGISDASAIPATNSFTTYYINISTRTYTYTYTYDVGKQSIENVTFAEATSRSMLRMN